MAEALTRPVDVTLLRPGLYVSKLDRSWLETPFPFQGFMIENEHQLAELRRYCRYVFVDEEQSREPAMKALIAGLMAQGPQERRPEPQLVNRERRPAGDDLTRAFGKTRRPNWKRFKPLLHQAAELRSRSRLALDRVLEDVRLGRSVNTEEARCVVEELTDTVTNNASAALWLTNLKNRDEYTAIHCLNVCVLALAFGRHLGMERRELEILGLGALLHDVGKMLTPPEVLNKPGRLTKEEFAIMRLHPEEGFKLVRRSGGVPESTLQIIRLHHERLSGRGYPLGLGADDIPLPVLITGIVDVYDAMTSERVYKSAMPADRALKALYDAAEDEFGRELVEEFIRCVGIYPVGSVVELNSGALGVVMGADPSWRLQPVVLLVRDEHGRNIEPYRLVNLAALAEKSGTPSLLVRRVVEAEEHGIDVAAIARSELGR